MATAKKVRTTRDKLNKHQLWCIDQAHNGNAWHIVKACLDCRVAIAKVEAAGKGRTKQWAKGMVEHYLEILEYLEERIPEGPYRDGYLLETQIVKGCNHG